MPSEPRTISAKILEVEALDQVAREQHRERDELINEAILVYLQLQDFHKTLIMKGLRQAEEGLTVSHSAVQEISRIWSNS